MANSTAPSTEKLRRYLEQFSPFAPEDWELFRSMLKRRVFAAREVILKRGEVEQFVSFVERGIIRYFVQEKEKDITFEITFEGSFATAYDSFLLRAPAQYQAEALVGTEVWSIGYADLQDAYRLTGVADRIGRLIGEQLYIRKNKRQLSLLRDSAEERYLLMLRDHAHFLQHVPLKFLASYIGITPQALSRIRRRISGD